MENTFYWHWFHTLKGITQKEKEELLKRCPEIKEWYESEALNKLLPEEISLSTEQENRREKILAILECKEYRESARRSYEALQQKEIHITSRG